MSARTEGRGSIALFIAIVALGLLAGGTILRSGSTDPEADRTSTPTTPRTSAVPKASPPGIPDDEAPLDLPGDELFKGTYELERNGEPYGTEEFRVTHHGAQLLVDVRRRSLYDPAEKLSVFLTEDSDFRRAEWVRYGDSGFRVDYRREGSALRAAVVHPDGSREAQEVPFRPGSIAYYEGPSAWLGTLFARDLAPDSTLEVDTITFGGNDWRMRDTKSSLTREVNEVATRGQEIRHVFNILRPVVGGDDVTRLRVRPGGLLLSLESAGPDGTLVARLIQP